MWACSRKRRHRKHGIELMGATEVAGIADHELVLQSPEAAERLIGVTDGFYRFVIGPVVDDVDIVQIERVQLVGHLRADHDVGGGRAQRPIAQVRYRLAEPTFKDRGAELDGDFGIEVLQPVDEVGTAAFGGTRRRDREQRRIGHRHQDVVGFQGFAQPPPGRGAEQGIVDSAAGQSGAAKGCGGNPADTDAVDVLFGRQARVLVVVAQRRGDDVDLPSGVGQMEGEVGQNLAGGRVIGVEIAIEDDEALHHITRASNCLIASRSSALCTARIDGFAPASSGQAIAGRFSP